MNDTRTAWGIFEQPDGPVVLDPKSKTGGRWWANRATLGLDANGRLTVEIADGEHVVRINGTPAQLRRVASTIVAQVEGATANTTEKN